jgi:tetratricopeptide (TPR) repeat protein
MNGFLPFEPLDAYESLQLLLPPYSLKLSEPDLRSFIVNGFVRKRLVLRGRFEEFGHTRVMRSPEEMTIKSFLAANIPRESVNPIYKGDAVGCRNPVNVKRLLLDTDWYTVVVDETEKFYTKDDERCLTELTDNVGLTFVYNRPTLRQPFLIARDMTRSVRYLDSVGEIQDEVSVVPHDTNTNIFAFLRTGAESSSFLTEAFELAVDRKSRFGYSDEALLAMKGLALIYRILKRLEDAKNVLSRALGLSYSTQVVSTKMRYELLYDFAALYLDHGDTNNAEIQFSLIERHYRDDNADKFHTLCSKAIEGLATIALEKGLLQQAESLFHSALEQNFGNAGISLEHTIKSKLGMVYCAQGQLDRAYRLCEESLEYQKELLGDRHYHSLRTMHLLAGILFEKISLSEAEHFYVHELSGLETLLGPYHLDTLKTKELLACVYRGQSRFETAQTIWKDLFHTYESLLGPEHFCTIEAQLQLCQLLGIDDRLNESVKCLKSLCEMTDRLYGPSHPTNRRAKFLLANVYHKLGNFTSYESIRDQIRLSSEVHGTTSEFRILTS